MTMTGLNPDDRPACLWVDADGKLLVNSGSGGPLPEGARPATIAALQCDEDGNLLLSED